MTLKFRATNPVRLVERASSSIGSVIPTSEQ
jgi:hypothetical protein